MPPTAIAAHRDARALYPGDGDRVIVPVITASIRARAYSGDRLVGEASADIGGTILSIPNLPVDEPLSIEVAALGAGAAIVTSWSGTATLENGDNELYATLVPVAEPTSFGTVSTDDFSGPSAFSMGTEPVALGAVRFFSFINTNVSGEYQIIYDTAKARWARLEAYDAEWKPLPVVCSDPNQGWVVLSLSGANQVVNVMVVNSVDSPGYPAGDISGEIKMRRARFCAVGATGSGTFASPLGVDDIDNSSLCANGDSVFVAGGDYQVNGRLLISFDDYKVYGGFSSDWKSRGTATNIVGSGTNPGVPVYNIAPVNASATCLLDGLTIRGYANTIAYPSNTALLIDTPGSFIMNGCSVFGNASNTVIANSTESCGIRVTDGACEIAASTVHAGNALCTAFNATARAISLDNPTTSRVAYVHNCSVDGGYALNTATGTVVQSTGIYMNAYDQGLVLACSRIWGGVAVGDSTPYVYSAGILVSAAGTSNMSINIANCQLSGGYSSSLSGAAVYSFGLDISRTNVSISGCAIDGGMGPASNGLLGGIHVGGVPCNVRVMSCVLFTTNVDANGSYAIHDANGNLSQIEGGDIVSAGACLQWFNGTAGVAFPLFLSNTALYSGDNATLPAFFKAYSPSFAGFDYPTYNTQWLTTNDWGLASAGASFITGVGNPITAGYISALDLATWPALGLDLAGKARPTSGAWARGAYEP